MQIVDTFSGFVSAVLWVTFKGHWIGLENLRYPTPIARLRVRDNIYKTVRVMQCAKTGQGDISFSKTTSFQTSPPFIRGCDGPAAAAVGGFRQIRPVNVTGSGWSERDRRQGCSTFCRSPLRTTAIVKLKWYTQRVVCKK